MRLGTCLVVLSCALPRAAQAQSITPAARAQSITPAPSLPAAPSTSTAPPTPPPATTVDDDLIDDAGVSESIEVVARAPAESASSVHFDRRDLIARPHTRPSDLLRQTPGLVVAQHAGGGKADQYFLRGFDADHGTDVALFVDGIPVNLTSHGHGQGYADSHWLIPETIGSIDVHKGPYAARYGDFTTAGAIEMRTIDPEPGATVWLTGGTQLAGPAALRQPTGRLVGMVAPELRRGRAMLAAEVGYTDGPFLSPQGFAHAHLLAKASRPLAGGEGRVAATFYASRWDQSGQVPSAEVAAGRLDRFGSLDPTEGGDTRRASLAVGWSRGVAADGAWDLSAYLVDYRLTLFSNFTLFARDPVVGDQIEQNDDRTFGGASAIYRKAHGQGDRGGLVTAGLQARGDTTVADLWHTAARRRVTDCWMVANPCNRTRNDVVDLAAFIEEDLSLGRRLRVLAGLRVNQFLWRVDDLDPETRATMDTTGGAAQATIVSPKLSAIVTVSKEVDLFVNGGLGFHANDARAAVATDGDGALARAIGAEVGARLAVGDELTGAAALWYLRLASEQVWSGDLGGTEPSDPTRRYGLDLELTWRPRAWLAVDGNVAIGRSTFVANQGNGGALALAPRLMGGAGVTVRRGPSFASLRVRGIGDRPASDDGLLTAQGFALVDLVAQHPIGATTIGVSIENLLDAAWREAQFAEESRVTPMAPLAEDVHFTPGAPLTALITVEHRL